MRMTRLVLVAVLLVGVPTYAAGSAQKGPTSGAEMMPPFDPRYFLGEWEIEWNPPETGLVPPGKWTGTETITHVNNRYLAVAIVMEHEDGTTLTGDGVMFYEFGMNGQSMTRFVRYDAGFSIFQYGPLTGSTSRSRSMTRTSSTLGSCG